MHLIKPLRALRYSIAFAAFFCLLCALPLRAADAPTRPPNIVMIFCDDMGYGDLSCYGSKGAPTPNLDRMAAEGVRFTDFYVPQAVCSASRAGLLTGCYNVRVGIMGALGPKAKIGLNPAEFNLARICKSKGYATAIFGKWHLGSLPQFLPLNQGFDEYAGTPYSHDMWPHHPETPKAYPDLPLYEQDKVIKLNPSPDMLTGFYTEHAVRFIEAHKDQPFFLYVPHNLPHVPLGAGPSFKGKSGFGLYGDVITELDWSVGQILDAIKRNNLDDNTLVMFASDNGPWTTYGDHAGSAGPLREAKGTSFDGGVREPFIARWPGHIPSGKVCKEPAMTIDILPTVARLIGVELPKDKKIDGLDIWPLITSQPGAKCPHEAFYIYWNEHLEAVRSGKYKLHFPHNYRETPKIRAHGGIPTKAGVGHIGLALFDLENDPGETTNLAEQYPEVVKHLEALADKMREDLGDSATRQKGPGRRPPGRADK
jgi:arylsulfatase A-like enzyme